MNNGANRGNEIKNKLAKKAVTAAGGPVAGKALDIADKLGKKSGNADLLNKQQSAANQQEENEQIENTSSSAEGSETSSNNKENENAKNALTRIKDGLSGNSNAKGEFTGYGDIIFSVLKKHWKIVVASAASFFFLLLFIIVVPIIVSSVGGGVVEFFTKVGDALVGFFHVDEEQRIVEYYQKLEKVQNRVYKKKGVCIDVNLITATLTVDLDAAGYVKQSHEDAYVADEEQEELNDESEVFDIGDNDSEYDYISEQEDGDEKYKKMTKEIEILANMQMKTIKHGRDKELLEAGEDCRPEGDELHEVSEVVSEENKDRFTLYSTFGLFSKEDWDLKYSGYYSLFYNDYISDSPDLVAKHDKRLYSKFFTKKANEETNYEFRIYSPVWETVCDEEGNCEPYCAKELPKNQYELSIGDLNTMEQSVYYWNLVNSFIPNYYDEYLPEEGNPEREEAIKGIAELIYLLYNDLGPNHECKNTYSDGYSTVAYSTACPNGVPVKDPQTKLVTFVDLEDYVAGVVASENAWHQGDNIENMKAQAVAARSYVLANTESCTIPIENSSRKQNYKPTTDPYAIRAAQETAGMVLYKDGKILSAEYDAFCVQSVSGDTYIIKQQSQSIPKEFLQTMSFGSGKTYADINYCFGHGRGMSQIGSRYLQTQGYDFTRILDYYYGDGTGIQAGMPSSSSGLSLVSTSITGDWASWKQKAGWWADLAMPNPTTWVDANGVVHHCTTISNCGCAITSVAIQIARSGVATSLGADFDVGTFYQAMRQNNGFTNNSILWGSASSVAEHFVYQDEFTYSGVDDIQNRLNNGEYLVANVKNGGHWVAIVGVENGRVIMADPGSSSNDLLSTYAGTIGRVEVYKVQ